MRKELELEMLDFENEISKVAKKIAKEQDEFIMKRLEKIEHKYAGYRINNQEPYIQTTEMFNLETPIKCNMTVQFIGFDNEKEVDYYVNKGFNIFVTKDITEIIKSYNKEINNVLKLLEKEDVISSLGIEDYLESYLNNEDNSLKDKIIMSNFLNDYMDKDLYVVEFFRDKGFYIRVENEDDEIISDELFLGVEVTKEESKNIDKNIEHYELLINTDMTINKFVDNILNDEEISAEDKIFMIRDFIKYLNKGLYRQDAEDMFGNMCQLIMDQNTHEIIDKINY